VSLAHILSQRTNTPKAQANQPPPITKYTKSRFRRSTSRAHDAKNRFFITEYRHSATIAQDPAVRLYLDDLAHSRGNNGVSSTGTEPLTYHAVERFLEYTSLPITNHSMSDLVAYKTANPSSRSISQAGFPRRNSDTPTSDLPESGADIQQELSAVS